MKVLWTDILTEEGHSYNNPHPLRGGGLIKDTIRGQVYPVLHNVKP